MVRTQRGRVVYDRVPHEFKQSDLDRILKTLDEKAKDLTVWEAVQATFREIWSYRNWTIQEAVQFYSEAFDELDEYLGMLDEAIMFVTMLKTGGPRAYTPTKEGFHGHIASMARRWADTIEEKE